MICKIPKNRAALSILGTNSISDGDDFRDDGWVYRNNMPVKKWFEIIPGVNKKIWFPKYNNIDKLEESRWKAQILVNQALTSWRSCVFNIAKHGYITGVNKFSTYPNRLVKITCNQSSVGWEWHDEHIDTEHIKQDLTNEFFALDKRYISLIDRLMTFNAALLQAIARLLLEETSIVCIDINKRSYWVDFSNKQVGGRIGFMALPEEIKYIKLRKGAGKPKCFSLGMKATHKPK